MKVSHADNDYLKLKKDSSEKYLCVYQYKFYVNHEIYFYGVFFTFQKRKTTKSGILEILPSWYILSLKP